MSIYAAEHRMRVGRIQRDDRLDFKGKKQAVWNYFLTAELQNGSQFLVAQPGGQLYMVLGTTNEVIQLPRAGRGGDAFFSYLHTIYGLPERDDYTKTIYDVLRHYVFRSGTKVELRRFAAYDQQTRTAYMSAYNGRMYKIDGSDVTDVPIGEDGIFFADDDRGEHVDPDIGNHGMLVERLTDINFAPSGLSGITPEQQKRALIVWIFALAFPDLMPTKPILLVEGPRGAGKTSCAQMAQWALMGTSRPMILRENKEDDFGVILLRSPIALFDNTDSFIKWVPDAVAAYCTGAGWNSRKLYTDDEQLEIRPHAFIAVATRNPASFRRDDVADRCVILRLERRKKFMGAASLKRSILDNRSALLGEYLWYVGQIVNELRQDLDLPDEQTDRMADFAALARVVGKVLNWPENAVPELMLAMQAERDAFASEDDPLVDLINRWLAYPRPHLGGGKYGQSNIGRLVTALQLHAELETLAQAGNIEWKDSTRTLTQKIRTTLVERSFHVEQANISGTKMFRFWRHSDARLEIVSEDAMPPVLP